MNKTIILTLNRNQLLNNQLIISPMRIFPQLKCIEMLNTLIHRITSDNLMISNHHPLETINETFKEVKI